MPIYEYRCNACGAEQEHLQKMSDDPIAVCPECGSSEYVKQVSAPGFQLKGNGWYETDFKNNKGASKPAETKTKSKPAAQPSKPSSAAAD